ncbi:DUF3489 domain-containing protein [Magnetococcales bacterium HHB-1]
MIKLTDAQHRSLTAAYNRLDGTILPLPNRIKGAAKQKIMAGLGNRGLIAHNTEGQPCLSDLGRWVLNQPQLEYKPSPRQPRRGSKAYWLIKLMQRPEGATMVQMMAATNWQAHTLRGTISGSLRKKMGWTVLCERDSQGKTVYRIK